QARTLEHLGREDEARARLETLLEQQPLSYYAGLAEERLGREPRHLDEPEAEPAPAFPATLGGPHAARARLLAELGFPRLARGEVAALEATGASSEQVVDAYRAVGAPGDALRVARTLDAGGSASPRRDLYPLGYWPAVRTAAQA